MTDWQTDTALISNNSLHLMHSMQPNNLLEAVKLCGSRLQLVQLHSGAEHFKAGTNVFSYL